MNNNYSNTSSSSSVVKLDIIERLKNLSNVHSCKPLIEQFLKADPVEQVKQVHSISAANHIENYYLVLSDETLHELIELTIRDLFKRHFFCHLCSYFNHEHRFVACVHLLIHSWDHLISNHHLVMNMFHKSASHIVRKWLIESFWHQDYRMQTLYYISWLPQELFTDVFEFVLEKLE